VSNQRKALGTALETRLVKVARALGLRASRQPLSGALKDYPGDVVVEEGLVEAKVRSVRLNARGERILSIDLGWLEKVEAEAKRAGFEWSAVIVRPKNSPRLLCLIDADLLLELLRREARHGKAGTKAKAG
jgi:hypothetical protein